LSFSDTHDVVILTDPRYESDTPVDWYTGNILLEEGLVQRALQAHGLRTCRRAWSDSRYDWSGARSALFRSTWDYFDRFSQFAAWLDRVSQVTRLCNSAELVRWNWDKHYLADLQQRGVRIPETIFLDQNCQESLAELIGRTGWPGAILKPAVSGAARHTYWVRAGDTAEHEKQFRSLLLQEPMLLQCFQERILSEGELSLVVIGGRVTHAVRKIARAGDFRVQDDHGGTVHPHVPSIAEIEFAEQVVAACDMSPVYARVDAVCDNSGRLALMELELIEPELFFRFQPSAAETLANHLVRWLGQ
jgi:glutathione synthase/RimK-type ligase-like ATP-grasp enzyme